MKSIPFNIFFSLQIFKAMYGYGPYNLTHLDYSVLEEHFMSQKRKKKKEKLIFLCSSKYQQLEMVAPRITSSVECTSLYTRLFQHFVYSTAGSSLLHQASSQNVRFYLNKYFTPCTIDSLFC